MRIFRKLWNDVLTGADNKSYDNGRVVCFISFIVYYILSFMSMYSAHPWSAIDFASGCTAMAIGFGMNLHLKKETEPK